MLKLSVCVRACVRACISPGSAVFSLCLCFVDVSLKKIQKINKAQDVGGSDSEADDRTVAERKAH